MKTSSLQLLEKLPLPPGSAHAVLEVMESAFAPLATKVDLQNTETALRKDIQALELKFEVRGGEIRTEIQVFRADIIREIWGATRWNFLLWMVNIAAFFWILALRK